MQQCPVRIFLSAAISFSWLQFVTDSLPSFFSLHHTVSPRDVCPRVMCQVVFANFATTTSSVSSSFKALFICLLRFYKPHSVPVFYLCTQESELVQV